MGNGAGRNMDSKRAQTLARTRPFTRKCGVMQSGPGREALSWQARRILTNARNLTPRWLFAIRVAEKKRGLRSDNWYGARAKSRNMGLTSAFSGAWRQVVTKRTRALSGKSRSIPGNAPACKNSGITPRENAEEKLSGAWPMTTPRMSSLRCDDATLAAIRTRLARESSPSNQRRSRRYPFRARVLVEFLQNDHLIRDTAACRDLSRDGAGLLVGRFVYEGTPCKITLISEYNFAREIPGKVVRCAYVSGTAGIHTVGVEFEHQIDIALFHRDAARPRVGLISRSAMQSATTAAAVKDRVELTVFSDAENGVVAAASDPFDLLLMDFDDPAMSACEVARSLRRKGYVRPMSNLSMNEPAEIQAHCEKHGCDACSPITFEPQALGALLKHIQVDPLLSTLSGSADAETVIDGFVFGVRQEMNRFETAFANGDLSELASLAKRLARHAGMCGFQPIAVAAQEFADACKAEAPAAKGRDLFSRLAQMCHAARPSSSNAPPPQ
jgi:CheY-like chemotaxis protein